MSPTFGHARLPEWPLDPAITYLNHGTVGVAPLRVLAAQQAVRDAMERQPATYLFRDANHLGGRTVSEVPLMRAAATEIGAFIGARGEDVVFVDNATAGVNAVLRSLEWREGDEVLVTDHSYGAVTLAARGITRTFGASVRELAFPRPAVRADAIVEAVVNAIGPRTKLAILDHVTSGSALVLPIERLAAACHARGVPVLVDGAHAPGALPLDLPAIGADWYTGNLHKWALAPRSCGILWAPPERQAGLHAPVLSWGLDQGFAAEFDWMGTRDPSPWLAAPEGVRALQEWDVDAIRTHNHALAWNGAHEIAEAVGTRFEVEEAMVGCMATLPLPARFGATMDDAYRLRDALLFEDRIEAPVLSYQERLWLRICAQLYNEEADYAKLAGALARRG
jgi:isopenicillin-N epimerase